MGRFFFLAILIAGAMPAARGQELGGDSVGDYFVNIAMVGQAGSVAYCEALQVEARRLLPSEPELVNWISDQDFFKNADGATYRWRQVGDQFHLYKFVAGRRPVEVRIHALLPHPAKKPRYLLQLRGAVPDTFTNYALDKNLAILGILGVTAVGRHVDFDFVAAYQPSGQSSHADFPDVMFANAEAMLRRYAYEIGVGGLPVREVTSEDRIPTPDDPNGRRRFFNAVLAKQPGEAEQNLLDRTFNGEDNIFFGETRAADIRAIPNRIAGIDLTPAITLKCIYVPRQGRDKTRKGGAHACFVPIKIRSHDNAAEFYPIFVFAGAFFSHETLTAAVVREYYHAQWWQAIARLDRNDGAQRRLREYLLRLPYPWLELDIHYAVNSRVTIDTAEGAPAKMVYEMNKVFVTNADREIANPRVLAANRLLPWSQDADLVTPSHGTINGNPSTLYEMPDAYYAQAMWEMAKKLDDKKGRILPLERLVAAGPNPQLPNPPLNRVEDLLIAAIGSGFTRGDDFRSARLRAAVDAVKADWRVLLPDGYLLAGSPDELADAVAGTDTDLAFRDHDLAYLAAVCPSIATRQLFQQRLAALITDTVSGANSLLPDGYEHAVVNIYDQRNQTLQANLHDLGTDLALLRGLRPTAATLDQTRQNLLQQVQNLQNQAQQLQDQIANMPDTLTALDQAITEASTAMQQARNAYLENETQENSEALNTAYGRLRDAQQAYDQEALRVRTLLDTWRGQREQILGTDLPPIVQQANDAVRQANRALQNVTDTENALRGRINAQMWPAQVRYLVDRHFRDRRVNPALFWTTLDETRQGLATPPPDLQVFQ